MFDNRWLKKQLDSGKKYTDCDWCRKSPCSYHYNSPGMEAQSEAVAAAMRKML